ncbi:MAG: carboxyl transferase domain-containing protein [Nocardioides sp.]
MLGVGGSTHRTFVVPGGDGTTVDVDGLPHRISADGGGTVRAGFPGMIVSVLASVGDQVEAGDTLLTIESMKLESRVLAPAAGVVREVHVGINSQVGSGEPLVRLDVVDDDDTAGDDSSVDFAALASDTPDRTPLDVLRTVVLGLDAASGETDRLSAGLLPTREDAAAQLAGELDVLAAFADIHSLGPRRAALAGRVDAPERAHLVGYLRERHREDREFPDDFLARLDTALALVGHDESDDVAHLRLYRSLRRRDLIHSALASILRRWLEPATTVPATEQVRTVLERVVWITEGRSDQLEGLARSVLFRLFSQPVLDADLAAQTAIMTERIQQIGSQSDAAERTLDLRTLAFDSPPWEAWLLGSLAGPDRPAWEDVLVVVTADNYRHRRLVQVPTPSSPAAPLLMAEELDAESDISVIAVAHLGDDTATAAALEPLIAQRAALGPVVVELLVTDGRLDLDPRLARACLAATQVNATVLPVAPEGHVAHRSWAPGPGGDLTEVALFRDLHPCLAERLELWRLRDFDLQRQPAPPATFLFTGTARDDERDKRLFALAEVRTLTAARDDEGTVTSIPELEQTLLRCFDAFRVHDSTHSRRSPFGWNRVMVQVQPPWDFPDDALQGVAHRIAHAARGLSLDQIVLRLRGTDPGAEDRVVHLTLLEGEGVQIGFKAPSDRPLTVLRGHRRTAAQMRRRGLHHPADIVRLLTSPGAAHSDLPSGDFTELELVDGTLVPVEREIGENAHGVVIGEITNRTPKHPEGMRRVIILSDPSKSMASLGEGECVRIIAALELAHEQRLPVDWFAVSSGARVSMDSGTENLDWTARVLRTIIELAQLDLEINVVLTGVNVGAQSYWDAEATMLMHTRGVLIATGDNAMVLTGKDALDYSGAVSADDNAGIGGYEQIMGPNGQAQYWAPSLIEACHLLFRHYAVAYVAPGESGPRRAPVTDPAGRSIAASPHHSGDGGPFATVGDIFDDALNPERKLPFDIRSVMAAVKDDGDDPLERWPHMRDAENAVVWDTHVSGFPVQMIGIESRDLQRHSVTPNDGPRRWSAGTLFPRSSKKVARALNASNGVRPTVILANLSGFDGSPESMRELQLEYGAEIGRAVVNHRSPLVFCVLSRYHGGAFVVFSKALNERLESIAVAGARASVLGGAPAAAVVFAREVAHRVAADPRVVEAQAAVDAAGPDTVDQARLELAAVQDELKGHCRGVVGREFDGIHTIERAKEVGSVDQIVTVDALRDAIVATLESEGH